MTIVAITGADGFLGYAISTELQLRGVAVRELTRSRSSANSGVMAIGSIGNDTDWSTALSGVTCIIHCAARAHILRETESDPLLAYRTVNVQGTERLAEQAAAKGVRRLIFLSSIGVLGVHTDGRAPFSVFDSPAPSEPYGISKWEAEQSLWRISCHSGIEVVVVRPPLVYGPGVRANFLRLLKLVELGLPLPFGCLENLRSFVALDNLVDLLITCIDHPAAAGQTFLVSDGQDLSTPDLIRLIAKAKGRKVQLVSISPTFLRILAKISGYLPEMDRLISSLQVDIRHTCETLRWVPLLSVEEGLRRAVLTQNSGSHVKKGYETSF